jgi:hypothetical protein
MTQKTKSRPSKKRAVRKRKERRFAAGGNYMAPWVAAVGLVGALVLGAGVFGLWIKDPPIAYASYLVALGGLGVGIALWFAQSSLTAIYVGDGGIALESGNELERLAWCDIESIRVIGGRLVARSGGRHAGPAQLSFPVQAHKEATAWVLKEAAERIPDALDVSKDVLGELPSPASTQGVEQEIDDAQVAGRRCAASGKVIAFEGDARLCPRCGQVYHKDHVPSSCASCEEPLAGRTLQV